MSQYPPPSYGQWPDPSYMPYSQTPQDQSQNQNNHGTPVYDYPPVPATAAARYTASQAAFNYNTTQIPGLGISGGATPSQYNNAWPTPPNNGVSGQQHTQASQKQTPKSTPATAPNTSSKTPANDPNDAMEEGELTEEDFDDLYEPQLVDGGPKPAHVPAGKTDPPGRRDTQDEAFYETEPGEVSAHGGTPGRERSGSYSPYLSPREVDLDAGASRDASDVEPGRVRPSSRRASGAFAAKQTINGANPPNSAMSVQLTSQTSVPHAETALSFKSADEAKKEAQKSILRLLPLGVKLQNYIEEGLDESIVKSLFTDLNLLPPSPPSKDIVSSPQMEKQAALESSKAAPSQAKDQTEERKDRIARLLAAKAAKTAPANTAAPASSAAVTAPAASASQKPAGPATTTASALPSKSSSIPTAPAAMQKLAPPPSAPTGPAALQGVPPPSAPKGPAALQGAPPPSAPTGPAALQNGPPPSAPTGPASLQKAPPPSAPTAPAALRKDAGPSPAGKAKSKTDKELLLKKKMEALLKAREAQAQQAAAAKSPVVTTPGASSSGNRTPIGTLPKKPEVTIAPSGPIAVATLSAQPSTQPSAQPTPKGANPSPMSAQPDSSIPGLSLSTSAGPQPASAHPSRKRPVAADFVDYSSIVGAPKRPFGQHRQDSFVIDISDEESDEDEDVDMDMDSPAGRSPSSSSQNVDTPGRRGPSIKDFPPLSDGPLKRPLSRTNSNGPRPAKLHQLNGEISSLQRKIAELEARKAKKAGSGAQTPDVAVGTPIEFREPTNGEQATESVGTHAESEPRASATQPRAVSTSDVDSNDLPSAQLISEAASAGLPNRPESPRRPGQPKPKYGELAVAAVPRPISLPKRPEVSTVNASSDTDRRTRIASIHLPKIEATLLEKKTKLKLLEHKTAQLRLEIERELAEKEKLAEELRQLETEPASDGALSQAAAPDVLGSPLKSLSPSSGNVEQQTERPLEPTLLPSEPSGEVAVEAAEPASQQQGDEPEESTSAPENGFADTQPMELDENKEDTDPGQSPSVQPTEASSIAILGNNTSNTTSEISAVDTGALPVKEPNEDPVARSTLAEADEANDSAASTPESGQINESEQEETPLPQAQGKAEPETPEIPPSREEGDEEMGDGEAVDGSPLPVMISDVGQPASNELEDYQGAADEEIISTTRSQPLPSFTPYESPLKYFRSYRFHPEYAQNVSGGLRSLTYTNKINPKQALCPNEITQQKCNDKDCRFQHFATMKPKDEQILIELGRADEFTDGEEKNKFIGGLRDVLSAFRAAKVRDYDKIGYGIIDYRRKFIGDDSRVLVGLNDTKI